MFKQFDNNYINNLNSQSMGMKKNSLIKDRVNLISTHMYKQYLEYMHASQNTSEMFKRILVEMDEVTNHMKQAFAMKDMPNPNISSKTDADKSVGIMNILWQSVSLTTRGNTRPQALKRKNNPPLFCGRILALNGDFQDASLEICEQEYPDILNCEIASLFIPADPTMNAIIKVKHLGDTEYLINQIDAPREFLLKVTEIICGGGFFHEEAPDWE